MPTLYRLRCAAMAAMEQAIWPLMGLQVVTPMLTLRYITDDLGMELALLAAEGVHDPATMPFSTPWTDVPSPELEHNTLRFYWRNRADTTVAHWDLNLAVVVDGVAVGMCSIEADAFPTRRSAETGSWVGRGYQRRGIGREVRHAALHLIFAGFDADQATTPGLARQHRVIGGHQLAALRPDGLLAPAASRAPRHNAGIHHGSGTVEYRSSQRHRPHRN